MSVLGRTALLGSAWVAVFGCKEPIRASSPAGLLAVPVGSAWVLTWIEGSAPIIGSSVTLSFESGRLQGFAGCNHYEGSYNGSRINGDTASLVVIGIGATERACMAPPGVMDQEQRYFHLLNAASITIRDPEQLQMLDAHRRLVLVFALANR